MGKPIKRRPISFTQEIRNNLTRDLRRLSFGWPFHLHEIMLDNGYGGDVHNKYNRLVASFRNIERARAFMNVLEIMIKENKHA